jgi:hypothetical protein
MRYFTAAGALPIVAALAGGCAPPQSQVEEAGPLEGVWETIEVSLTSPDTSWTNPSPQPSLLIFTQRQYSITAVLGREPRELLSDQPSDAERLAAYDAFAAHSGTYELSDSTLTARPIVALDPNFMSGGASQTYTFRVSGDTLWRTFSPRGAPDTELRVTSVRTR